MLLRNTVCLCIQEVLLPKNFILNFHFLFLLNQILWSKQVACQIAFYLITKNNVKYEVIKFEAPHNEVKNCIQEVLWKELIIHVHRMLALPSVAGICAPVRSMSVTVKVANSSLFQMFNVFFLYFYNNIEDWYAAGLKKRSEMREDPL